MERKIKCGATISKGFCNHMKIIQKIRAQHTGKARNQGTAENSHIVHCTHTSESTDVKGQNIQQEKRHYMHHK